MATTQVKEKVVSLIELFYDLIYVYAISRLTVLLEEPVNGVIPGYSFFRYIVLFFVILQAWLYLTNYINRYGTWTWYDYLFTGLNMAGAVYLSNTISVVWEQNYLPFNIAMLFMLLCVTALYFIRSRKTDLDPGAAKNSLKILLIICALYVIGLILIAAGLPQAVLWVDVIAVLGGAFLPFLIRGHFDESIISFPHLAERFELLTIITFGEGIVGMAHFFDIDHFTGLPLLLFVLILSLFGNYVLQVHNRMEHHRVARALPLMFSHYFIIISVNLMTIGFHLMHSGEAHALFLSLFLAGSELLFLVSMLTTSLYNKEGLLFTKKDGLLIGCAYLIGALITVLGRNNEYLLLLGMLIASLGCFCVNFKSLKEFNNRHSAASSAD